MTEESPPARANTRVIARNSLWLTLDTAIGFASSLICSVTVARVMGPEILGYYNYVLWVAAMAGVVANLGVPAATRKYAAEYLGKGDFATARAIVRATMRFQMFVASTVVAGGLIVVFTVVSPERRVYAALAVLSLMPALLQGVATAANGATEDLAPNVRASVISTLVNFLGVLLSLLLNLGLVGLTAALLVSRVVDFTVRYTFFRRRFAGLPDAEVPAQLPLELRRRIVRFCWQSTILLALDVVVWDRSEMFFLERTSTITEVAFYSLSFNITQNLLLVPRMFSWATGATLMVQQGRAPEHTGRIAATALRFLALVAVPMTLGLAALSGPALRLLYGTRYLPAIPVLGLLAVFCLGKALVFPVQQLLVATEKQSFLLRWGGLAAVVNITLDLLWIPDGGAMGAAMAKGVTYVLTTTGLWVYAARTFQIQLPIGALLKLLVSGVAMALPVLGVARALPPAAAVTLGVPLGAAIFVAGLRLTRYLDAADQERLLSLRQELPRRLRRSYELVVHLVSPAVSRSRPPR